VNKRRREILTNLAPAVDFAMQRAGVASPDTSTRYAPPGLAMRARPSAEAPAELLIYGRIGGGGWLMDGIGAADVAALLKEIGPGPVNVRINSGGGDVFDGVAIHSLLARHPGTVTTYVDGLAASAASFIMLASSRIVAARNSFVMIHDAMTYTYGNGDSHRSAGELLDKVSENIADMYAERAGEDVEHWRNLMTVNGEDGTWYTGQEAMDAGLVDEITGTEDDAEDTNALLSGWVDLLPATITANLKLPPDPVEPVETAARWDPSTMTEILKGVLA
jgi:ATP-dependent protease ClpP protease subunit